MRDHDHYVHTSRHTLNGYFLRIEIVNTIRALPDMDEHPIDRGGAPFGAEELLAHLADCAALGQGLTFLLDHDR